MTHITYLSATALAAGILNGSFSSVEVVQAYLQRIAEVNPRLNAVVQLSTETALAQAQAADTARSNGKSLGPLHGVPFTAKDVYETAGMIAAAGLEERSNYRPQHDAVVIARMRAAGAILLGKTNCPPGGGGGESDNPVYGRTNNPYNLMCTPGGSSGGEAAIIAAGGSPCGVGSDSGGSIRLPAHYCGIAGLRPTVGRVPNTGVLNQPGGLSDPRTTCGPMAHHVEDLALLLPIIAGEDGCDSGVASMPLGDYRLVNLGRLRAAWYVDDGLVSPTPATADTVRAAAQALGAAGIKMEECRPPGVEAAFEISRRYWRSEELNGVEYQQLLADWDAYRSRMLGFMTTYDLLLCPASATPAGLHGSVLDTSFSYTLPFSLTNYPALVVRAGTSPEGLPIGVQLLARPWREDIVLAAGLQIEAALGGWQPPVERL
ncbi:MAG: amidase [Anaerolineae bacterium]